MGNNGAVCLGYRIDKAAGRRGNRAKAGIHCAVGKQAADAVATGTTDRREATAHHNPAVCLDLDTRNHAVCVRVEGSVQGTVCRDAGDTVAGRTVERGEAAADKETAIRLDRDCCDLVIGRSASQGEIRRLQAIKNPPG